MPRHTFSGILKTAGYSGLTDKTAFDKLRDPQTLEWLYKLVSGPDLATYLCSIDQLIILSSTLVNADRFLYLIAISDRRTLDLNISEHLTMFDASSLTAQQKTDYKNILNEQVQVLKTITDAPPNFSIGDVAEARAT